MAKGKGKKLKKYQIQILDPDGEEVVTLSYSKDEYYEIVQASVQMFVHEALAEHLARLERAAGI